MAIIKQLDFLAFRALENTPARGQVGYVQYIREAYKYIVTNYRNDIVLAEKGLDPNLEQFERQEEAIRIVFERALRQAHGDAVVNAPNEFNAFLQAKRIKQDIDFINIAARIARDSGNLTRRLNQILQIHNFPIAEKANQLRAFFNNPDIRAAIEWIEILDLSYLNLKTIPKELNLLTGITRLNLSYNQLTELPDNFLNNAPALWELNLSYNQLTELPANFFNNADTLEHLNLSDNQITHLQDNFLENAHALLGLYLDHNQLTELPANFLNNAPALWELNLSYNQLTELPANFLNNTPALTRLMLNNNQITELPVNFLNNAPALWELYLSYNQLTKLPAIFLNNANTLTLLSLENNKFRYQEYMYNHPIFLVQYEYRNELYFLETYKIYRFLALIGNAVKLTQDSFRTAY